MMSCVVLQFPLPGQRAPSSAISSSYPLGDLVPFRMRNENELLESEACLRADQLRPAGTAFMERLAERLRYDPDPEFVRIATRTARLIDGKTYGDNQE